MSSIDQFITNAQLALFKTTPLKEAEIIELFLENKNHFIFKDVNLDDVVLHLLKKMNGAAFVPPTIELVQFIFETTVDASNQFTVHISADMKNFRDSSVVDIVINGKKDRLRLSFDSTNPEICKNDILRSVQTGLRNSGFCFDQSTAEIITHCHGDYRIMVTLVPSPVKIHISSELFLDLADNELHRSLKYSVDMVNIDDVHVFMIMGIPCLDRVIAEKKMITLDTIKRYINYCHHNDTEWYEFLLGLKYVISGESQEPISEDRDPKSMILSADKIRGFIHTAVADHHPGADAQKIADAIIGELLRK